MEDFSKFAYGIYKDRYAHPGEEWEDTAKRVTKNVLEALNYTTSSDEYKRIFSLIAKRQFLPGGRYLYASGRPFHQVQNCLLLKAEDSREGWADLNYKATMALQTGAGIGIDYSDIREAGAVIKRTGGVASGPLSLMQMVNEVGRGVMQGGSRRSAIWAGLNWNHPDIFAFIQMKNWPEEVRKLKEKDFTFPATLDMTNISVILDDAFFEAYNDSTHPDFAKARMVYEKTLDRMLRTAEPGFSIDTGENAGETLRNACTEITSRDDSDVCNLGSINMARFHSKEQFGAAVRDATLFLLAGTVYSDLPYGKVYETREKNRRLGLGLMGIHEWLLQRGYRYEPTAELGEWLEEYEKATEHAHHWADKHGLSRPIKTRAIAPTGTIGIIGETTTGIEPIYSVAFKRRVYNTRPGVDSTINFEYVVDPTAKRLMDQGIDPDLIEDAYSLARDVDRRLAMQAYVQGYVDHGISSTINIPHPIEDRSEQSAFGAKLMRYLPALRGVTVYPEGVRSGQPLTPVSLNEASGQQGVRYEESEDKCVGGVCAV